jgi:hypothetical protein
MSLDNAIALEAKDLLPETWEALSDADTFGDPALERQLNKVVHRVFGVKLTDAEIGVLDPDVLEYVGKKLALALLDPAIDYWSKQVISHTAGERESKAYKDRVEDLKEMRKRWLGDIASLYVQIETLIPVQVRTSQDAPRVIDAGDTLVHVTPNPFDIEPLAGEVEDVDAGSAT